MSFAYKQSYPSRRAPLLARNAVATSQSLAAQAGLRMLMSGGNAVDAGLAAAITLTLVEPSGNGLGSDSFGIYWDGAELHGLNASGRSPASWTPERFAGLSEMPEKGWDTVTVPGAVSGWVALNERFGRLDFEALFEPAIDYARRGFMVTPTIARLWERAAILFRDQPGFADYFLPGGRAPRAGELWRSEAHASTLEAIATSRGDAFYRGAIAEEIIAFSDKTGGSMTLDDLAAHQADWVGTVSAPYRGHALHEIPPNGQGIAAAIALGILERFDLASYPVDSTDSLHLQIEAMKLALADIYRYVADPAAMEIAPESMLDPNYLDARAKLIDMKRAGDPGHGVPPRSGTVYLTAADSDGRMLSYIQSNYNGFGSGVVVPSVGVHMQNRGSGFVLDPSHPNCVAPRKRPFHTIIPGFLMKGDQPQMSFGVMGGPIQAQGHVQMVVRTVDYGQDPQTAADAPRWRVQEGRTVIIETACPASTVAGLESRGHIIDRQSPDQDFGFGGAQLIWRTEDGYVAGSDPRKDGQAVGF